MAEITITLPDEQLGNLEIYLNPTADKDKDAATQISNIEDHVQIVVNNWVWEGAKQAAADAVEDPTA